MLEAVEILAPDTWEQALAMKAAQPDAVPIAGGTDLMVALNFDRARPQAILDLTRVPELRDWEADDGRLRIGAGVSYTRLIEELGERLPGLAIASRTVGSPQIRNRGTVGGNLGTASPAGDGLPPLYVSDAEVELASATGTRRLPVAEFVTGPKRQSAREDELIAAFHLPAATGPQQFAKIGTRNAMVIAVCSLALAIWPERRAVCACIGSAGPTPIRADEAEAFIAGVLDEDGLWESRGALSSAALERFGELVAAAAAPIDDVRGSATYRRHALGVLARRTLTWAWEEQRCA
ncbi:MAG TPA: FAD binding domain-containing protein [Solirubrobacteraceae bacterium]